MTLELKNPSFASVAAKNSSFDADYDTHQEFDFEELIPKSNKSKQKVALSPSEKKSSDSGFSERRRNNMSDRYSDDYDSYDDDFEQDNSSPRRHRSSKTGRYSRYSTRTRSPDISPKRRNGRRRDSLSSYKSAYGNYGGSSKANVKTKLKKSRSAADARQGNSRMAGSSSLVHRVLSANRHKVSRMHDIVEDLEREVGDLKGENKTLKRIHVRQEKEIRKIDVEEASLPQLLQRHSAEVRNLRERLKRSQDVVNRKEREARDRDDEMLKLRDNLKRYKELAAEKNLGEREALAKKLDSIEQSLAEKDKRIVELQKSMSLKEKARQRELKDQRDRYKHAKDELARLRQDFGDLKEKLQEKERELDTKNIYHQHIVQKKKQAPLALPAATSQPLEQERIRFLEDNKAVTKSEKKKNIFLTHGSDSSSVATNDIAGTAVRDDKPSFTPPSKAIYKSSNEHSALYHGPQLANTDEVDTSKILEQEKLSVDRKETERREQEERRREEEKRRKEQERRRQEEEEERERKRQVEEERKRKELEEQSRKQQEEERSRKEKEELEVDRKRQLEEEEIRKKKDLLLARMRVIDETDKSTKPNGIIDTGLTDYSKDTKPKKLPIFLQSDTVQEKEEVKDHPKRTDDIFSQSGSLKKTSAGSSGRSSTHYEVKQSYENLHQGLPAHPSEGHIRHKGLTLENTKKSEEDLTFGSYKPSAAVVRRRGARRDSNEGASSVGYAPSFGDNKKDLGRNDSGLDFSSRKNTNSGASREKKEQSSFGGYNPSLDARPKATEAARPDDDLFGLGSNRPARARRVRDENKTSAFGSDILSDNNSAKPVNRGNSLFGDDPFASAGSKGTNKNKPYSWENNVEFGHKSNELGSTDNSLLPLRKRLHAPGAETRAVSNALDNTIDDDIEEVIL